MFPTILYNFSTSYVINLININTSRKKLAFYIKYSTKTNPLIKFFKKINYIDNYFLIKINNNYYYKITPFYYKNLNIFKNFKLTSYPTRKYFISLKALKLLAQRSGNSNYIISTSKGIFTHQEAINKKLSGFVVGFFYN